LNTGYPQNHGVSANMNFRRDWINFFVNYGVGYTKAPGAIHADQQYNLSEPSTLTGLTDYRTKMRSNFMRGGLSNNVRFGTDVYLSDKTTLTGSFLYRYSSNENPSNLRYEDYDLSNSILGITTRHDIENELDENLEYTLNFTQKFNRKGHQLTADIQFQNNNEIEKSNITQASGANAASLLPFLFQKTSNNEGEKRLMMQADYIQPFGVNGKVELGYRSTIREVSNLYDVQQKRDTAGAEFVTLSQFSTDYLYNENIHAGYGIVSNQYKKLTWQMGLRAEFTNIHSQLKIETLPRDWNYVNFFPSAFLTYKSSDKIQYQLSYSRRISRPRFRDLNPISSFSDNRNFRIGNPLVQPEFTNSYEIGVLQNLEKSSIYTGVYYRATDGLIQRVTLPINENGERFRKPFNIGKENSIGVEGNISHEFSKMYRVSGNLNFFHTEIIGNVGDSLNLSAKATSFNSRISNNFSLKNVVDAQLNFNYLAPKNISQGEFKAMYSLDFGISKDILKKSGTIAMSATDLFNTRKYRYSTSFEGFKEQATYQRRIGPMFILTFTYRLNQAKRKPSDKSSGSYEKEEF
jgi:outer membrane receptor protein involved in Fe transport